jgi:hypothetical protein
VIIALACDNDLEIEHMDVVTAFLNAEVESDIYMWSLEGSALQSPTEHV